MNFKYYKKKCNTDLAYYKKNYKTYSMTSNDTLLHYTVC